MRGSPGFDQVDHQTLLAIGTMVDLLLFFAREPPDEDAGYYWGEFHDQMHANFEMPDEMDSAETVRTLLCIRDWAEYEIPVSPHRCLETNGSLIQDQEAWTDDMSNLALQDGASGARIPAR